MTLVPVEEMVLIRFQTVPFVIAAICELLHTPHPRAGGQFGPFLLSTTLEPNTSFAPVRRLVYLRQTFVRRSQNCVGAAGGRCTAGFRPGSCPLWVKSGGDDRDRPASYVRFTPKADKQQRASVCPLSAKTCRAQVQQTNVR